MLTTQSTVRLSRRVGRLGVLVVVVASLSKAHVNLRSMVAQQTQIQHNYASVCSCKKNFLVRTQRSTIRSAVRKHFKASDTLTHLTPFRYARNEHTQRYIKHKRAFGLVVLFLCSDRATGKMSLVFR